LKRRVMSIASSRELIVLIVRTCLGCRLRGPVVVTRNGSRLLGCTTVKRARAIHPRTAVVQEATAAKARVPQLQAPVQAVRAR
jgi:hypothetical protein